jgi:hypothetical protein
MRPLTLLLPSVADATQVLRPSLYVEVERQLSRDYRTRSEAQSIGAASIRAALFRAAVPFAQAREEMNVRLQCRRDADAQRDIKRQFLVLERHLTADDDELEKVVQARLG